MFSSVMTGKTIRCIKLALLLGLGISLVLGMRLGQEQTALANKVVRLHVIANSDTQADQALKLQVRDRILEQAERYITTDGGLDAALASLDEHMDELTAAATATVRAAGYDYPVTVGVEETWFPTKQYGEFAFPAGKYTALRIVIGEGQGQNWWCVLFPPLCMNAVTEPISQTAVQGGLSEQEVSLITGENEGYVIKFKAVELWDQLKKNLDDRTFD